MRIEWFEAKGYSHLSLNNIETIRISPEKKFHWILGTNGSGKSSLLSQLTPLTASPQDYQKGGIGVIHNYKRGNRHHQVSNR